MRKTIRCKACYTEYIDESFGADWDNKKQFDIKLIDCCCPSCGNKEFDEYEEDICYKNSKCSGWNKSFEQITDQQVFCATHSAAPQYTGEIFKYCPWCGEKIYQKD